jgi:hypothetical protein
MLEKLTKLVMEKELREMLNSSEGEPGPAPQSSDRRDDSAAQNMDESSKMPVQGLGSMDNDASFNYIEDPDPVMSQPLFDFDQSKSLSLRSSSTTNKHDTVFTGNSMNFPLEPLFPDLLGPGSGFGPEQGWIWGFDRPAHVPEG